MDKPSVRAEAKNPGRGLVWKIKAYWSLIKYLQSALLVLTGLAGFLSAKCPILNITTLVVLLITLAGSISGSTILNMWYDHDIDKAMRRTRNRPLPAAELDLREALVVGLIVSGVSVALAFWLDALYGFIILSGLLLDVVVYTMWLKRRTCFSIVWGGIAGAMPILAGRALAVGYIDWVGLVMGLGILLWIPTHILTFSMKYYNDYEAAGVPTFASRYGYSVTQTIIAFSSVAAAIAMIASGWGVGMSWGFMRLMGLLSLVLFAMALCMLVKPSDRLNYSLFKFASIYMFASMILIAI